MTLTPPPDDGKTRPGGRPPKVDRALKRAEQQAHYRHRQRRAQLDAMTGRPEGQPVRAILGALALLLADLDNPEKARSHDLQRWAAGKAVHELCARYGITPFPSP